MLRRFEARMLSGEAFTLEEIKRTFSTEAHLIERRLREFHRQGLIGFERHGLRVVWTATDPGKLTLDRESR